MRARKAYSVATGDGEAADFFGLARVGSRRIDFCLARLRSR